MAIRATVDPTIAGLLDGITTTTSRQAPAPPKTTGNGSRAADSRRPAM
jgi:hypothetical protein